MIVCVDVHYSDDGATGAAVAFEDWSSSVIADQIVMRFAAASDYQPGEFYKRELPCILPLLQSLRVKAKTVLVDGYVWLRDNKPGLGAHLHKALNEQVTVIGIAKNEFVGAPAVEVLRGESKRPLYVTSAGMDVQNATAHVAEMNGQHRIPEMLKLVDQLSRGMG